MRLGAATRRLLLAVCLALQTSAAQLNAEELAAVWKAERSLRALALAEASDRYDSFARLLDSAHSTADELRDASVRQEFERVLQVYDDVRSVWDLTRRQGDSAIDLEEPAWPELLAYLRNRYDGLDPGRIRSARPLRRLIAAHGLHRNDLRRFLTQSECRPRATLLAVEPSAQGLVIRTSAPVQGRVVEADSVQQEGFSGYASLTLELDDTGIGSVDSRQSWDSGPFATLRIVRFRRDLQCGVRVRLQLRTAVDWTLTAIADGVELRGRRIAAPSEIIAEGVEDDVSSGSVRGLGRYAHSYVDRGGSTSSSQVQAGFAQELPFGSTLRGFISSSIPAYEQGGPYGALELAGVLVGRTAADFAVGDLQTSLGGWRESSPIHSILLRGAGVSWLLPRRLFAQAFGGRAAEASLYRLRGDREVVAPLSKDNLFGLQAIWPYNERVDLAAGWVHSMPRESRARENFFQSVLWRLDSQKTLRLVTEQSLGGEGGDAGFAVTIEPRLSGQRFHLSGYLRFLSEAFQPPAGSSLFAGLRSSYGISGSYTPTERLWINGSFSQTKSYSVFDPSNVGTLTEFRGAAIGYRVSEWLTLALDHSVSELKSEPGALLPADSRTDSTGLTASLRFGRSTLSMRGSIDETTNRIDPSLNIESKRLDAEMMRPLTPRMDWFLRGRLADSEYADGRSAGADYGFSTGLHAHLADRSTLRGEIGVSYSPAGIALADSRRGFVNVGYFRGQHAALLGVQLSYELLQIGDQPGRHALFLSTNVGRQLQWGAPPIPLAPAQDRALPLLPSMSTLPSAGRLLVRAFIDADQDGRWDEGEPPVAKARVRIGDRVRQTNERGEVNALLDEGAHRVILEQRGENVDYYVASPAQSIELRALEQHMLDFALRPGGRLRGRVGWRGAAPAGPILGGIRMRLRGEDLSRETTTDDQGVFSFGVVPVGDFVISVDLSTLDPSSSLEGEREKRVSVVRGEVVSVEFQLRPATVRERFRRP